MLKARLRRTVLTLILASAGGLNSLPTAYALATALTPHQVAAPSPVIIPVAVFGTDERRTLSPGHQSLGDKIGLLTDHLSKTQCTAFCLGPDIIATAAHCLYRTRNEPRPNLFNFRFRLHGSQPTSEARIAGTRSAASVPQVSAGSRSLSVRPPIEATRDWALVRLDAPVCSAGGLPLSARTAAELALNERQKTLYQVGYHRDFPGGRLALGSPCSVSRKFDTANWEKISADFENPEQLLLHTCDTGGASSGSPLFVDGPEGPEVVGINVGTYVQSRTLTVNGAVAHRYQMQNVANTGVSTQAFRDALNAFQRTQFLVSRADMRELQGLLSGIGLYSGPRDGHYGAASWDAIETYERLNAQPVTGLATADLLRRLRTTLMARAHQAKPAAGPNPLETGSVKRLGPDQRSERKTAR